ncbi:MAG: ribosomal protein S18-alanine N-acetyltransferase [Thermomicrobiales bacterium]|nr:ribosomal protein S18-alanine N-acetyltransferase [Thermomicrobiales bacterium]
MTTLRRQSDDRADAAAGEPIYRLDAMVQDDVPEVGRVERRCFPNPWPASAYRRELQNPAQNTYVVLREVIPSLDLDVAGKVSDASAQASTRALPRRSLLPIGLGRRQGTNGADQSRIIGFAGMWLAFDEAHVTTIGVAPEYRGHGLGELLFLAMIDEAIARGANWLTLEVRVSNASAQALYRKYHFTVHGTRKRYYSDNNEDALIMWSPALHDAAFRADIERRRAALAKRLGGRVARSERSPLKDAVNGAGPA